jgi:hypothetical protein
LLDIFKNNPEDRDAVPAVAMTFSAAGRMTPANRKCTKANINRKTPPLTRKLGFIDNVFSLFIIIP